MNLLTQILTIYNWGVVCVLLFFLFNIARFFEKRSGKKQLYPFFLIPIILFAISAIIYAFFVTLPNSNVIADTLRILASFILGFTGYSLLNTMMGGRS